MIKRDIAGREFASFPRTKTKQLRLMAGVVVGSFMWAAFIYRQHLNAVANFQSSGFPWENFLYPVLLLLGGIGKVLYDLHLEMPYLNFEEDCFYFDDKNKSEKRYWREVIDIRTSNGIANGSPIADSRVVILLPKEEQLIIDPKEVDFQGADIEKIAKQFWKKACDKIS